MSVTGSRRGSTVADPAKSADALSLMDFANATDGQVYDVLNAIFGLFESSYNYKAMKHFITILKHLLPDKLLYDSGMQNALAILKKLATKKDAFSVSDLTDGEWDGVKLTVLKSVMTVRDGVRSYIRSLPPGSLTYNPPDAHLSPLDDPGERGLMEFGSALVYGAADAAISSGWPGLLFLAAL